MQVILGGKTSEEVAWENKRSTGSIHRWTCSSTSSSSRIKMGDPRQVIKVI